MKDIEFKFPEQVVTRVAILWDDLSFDDVRRAFEEWTML
jgi:hypothetical protein